MKVVLDTNVLISGIFFSGPPSDILTAWSEGYFEIVISLEILQEYRRVVEEIEAKYPEVEAQPVLDALIVGASICIPRKFDQTVCDDPTDDMFLECAFYRYNWS